MNPGEGCGHAYFCIQHVYTEVTERCLEEVILGAVFEKSALHSVASDLKSQIDTGLQTGSTNECVALSEMVKCLLVCVTTPVQRFQLLSGTAPTVRHKWLLSVGTCLLNLKQKKQRAFKVCIV